MYGIVTQASKTISNGRRLPRICFRKDPVSGFITMTRISRPVIWFYSLLTPKQHPEEIWHTKKTRNYFADKVNKPPDE